MTTDSGSSDMFDDGEEKGATGPSLYNNREAVNKEACPFGRD